MTTAEILDGCLKTGDEAAWLAFVSCFQPLIAGSILRVCRRYGKQSSALVDDLIQDTYLRLCKDDCHALRSFESRHEDAIRGYLKVIATTVALDYFRARMTQKRREEIESGVLPESGISSETIERAALLRELDQHLAASESARDRKIFWLYYQQGHTAKDIAAISSLGLTQKGVESCIYRLTQSLRDAVNLNLRAATGESQRNTLGVVK